MRAQNKDLQQQLAKVTTELQDTQDLNQTLITMNEEYGRENDSLYKKLDLYKNLKKLKTMESRKKRKRSRSGNSSEGNSDPNSDANEMDEKTEKKARVCIIFFRTILCQYLSNFYFSDNLDGDEIDFKNYTF